jgi:hypothetical protein
VAPGSLLAHATAANPRPPGRARGGPPGPPQQVTLLYLAAACLVAAQILGIYGLVSRKADLIFSIFMIGLVVASVVLGLVGISHQLG